MGTWKLEGENYLRQSGLPYIIIRPAGLHNKPGGTTALEFGQGDQMGFRFISRDDVAEACIQAAGYLTSNNNGYKNFTFEIAEAKDGSGDKWQKMTENSEQWRALFEPLQQD